MDERIIIGEASLRRIDGAEHRASSRKELSGCEYAALRWWAMEYLADEYTDWREFDDSNAIQSESLYLNAFEGIPCYGEESCEEYTITSVFMNKYGVIFADVWAEDRDENATYGL